MATIKNILVPVDFSKCSGAAMNFALEIAVLTNATVHALHVVYLNEYIGDGVEGDMWFDEYYERRWHDLTKWANGFKRKGAFKAVNIESTCEIGAPVTMIKSIALDKKADLIVMGATGATGLRAMMMGSSTAGVISVVQIPVLVVPEKAVFAKHADYVLATDFLIALNKHSWNVLNEILLVQHAGVHILHVLNRIGEQPEKAVETQLRQQLKKVACQFHYLRDENVKKAVSNYMDFIHAIGLVVIAHRHSAWYKLMYKSTLKTLVKKADTPIMVLHDVEK